MTGGPGIADRRIPVDPESGMPVPAPRRFDTERMDLPIGGPSALDRPIDRPGGIELDDGGGPGDESAAARRWAREQVAMRGGPQQLDHADAAAGRAPAARRASRTGAPWRTSRTGSAGSSCAPASTASRATSRSTRAACS